MKQLLQARRKILGETPVPNHESLISSKSKSSRSTRKPSSRIHSKENESPSHTDLLHSPSIFHAPKVEKPPLPRPQSRNPLKRKHGQDYFSDIASSTDTGVQVIVRMRPLNNEEENDKPVVQKISNSSLSVGGQTYTFDSVADPNATQEEIFQLVGVPLVENCLDGFNSSVFAYGQTGSGKTYTMWGPSTSACKDNFRSDQHGLMPRIFQRLFSRINEEQAKHADTQLNYNCRCSFLEIYHEQITDLLDPGQKNLLIREDVKSGVYVENLKEEYVFAMKDVTRLLLKGLSNRRTGSTSINTESSRSHSVFTCVVESRCKRKPDGISILKTSRINLVDLAGSERQKLTGAAGDRLKEAGSINRSLSQLGNLINILAEVSQSGKQRHIPYRDSRLTFLLQESLGGNAKLAMVCTVSPSLSCHSESFSTLRFAQRAKSIKNKAVVNEEMKEDVNHLREIILQLRDELHRVKKTNEGNNSSELDLRKSLSLLKTHIPLNERLPLVDEDGDEEMEIDEEAVENVARLISCTSPKMNNGCSDDENEAGSKSQRKRKSIALRRSSVRFLVKHPAKSDVDDASHSCTNCEILGEKLNELTRQNKILKRKLEGFENSMTPLNELNRESKVKLERCMGDAESDFVADF